MPSKKRKTAKLKTLRRPSVGVARSAKVRGGAEPISGKPKPAEPICDLRGR